MRCELAAKEAITHPQTATKEEVGSTEWHKQRKGSHKEPTTNQQSQPPQQRGSWQHRG
jgi:hypothetical protein